MDSIPFHYDVLVKNKLGLKLQSLRKLAASKKSARVVMNINYLVQKWKEMEKPKKTVLGKRGNKNQLHYIYVYNSLFFFFLL